MGKVTLEQKKRAVEIAAGGGNPLSYLKSLGVAAPDQMWYAIKKNLKKADPAKYELLPKRVDAKKAEPKAEKSENALECFEPFEMKDGRRRPVTTCCAPGTREGVEVPDEIPEVSLTARAEDLNIPDDQGRVTAPEDDFQIYGLKTKDGDFQAAAGKLCWTFDGFQMNLPVEVWRDLAETIPKVLGVMRL